MSKCLTTLMAGSALALLIGCHNTNSPHNYTYSPSAPTQQGTIEEIWNDYKANPAEAASKWTQVTVILTGTVSNIEARPITVNNATQSHYFVTLQDRINDSCTGVIRMIDKAKTTQHVLALKQGQTVSITAKLAQPDRFTTGEIPQCNYQFDEGRFTYNYENYTR